MVWFCSCLNCVNMEKEPFKVIYCLKNNRLIAISRNRVSAFRIYCKDFKRCS